jgi:hypothetical protein
MPIMEPYVEDVAGYQLLLSPADDLDGDSDPETNLAAADRFTEVTPPGIGAREDIAWFNISYLYIAGLKPTDGVRIGFIADETNSSDTGGGLFASLGPGSFRQALTTASLRGYLPEDNHGEEGGHLAYTDGSVEFLQGKDTMEDEIFRNVNRKQVRPDEDFDDVDVDELASSSTMTID